MTSTLLLSLALGLPAGASSFSTKLSTSAPSPEQVKRINDQVPAKNADLVVKDASLEKSAVGPGWTIIPLPAFSYNRNEGSWTGALAPIFRANDKGEVEDIFAPLYLHNEKVGETFTMNYFGYRDNTTQYHAVASYATHIERTVDVSYRDSAAGEDGRYIIYLKGDSGKSAFNRFYGLGDRTADQQESIYTLGDSNIKVAGGINLDHDVSVVAQERFREITVENGATDTLPQTLTLFKGTPGLEGADIWGQSVMVQHDTRDNPLTPLSGDLSAFTAEYARDYQIAIHPNWWRFTIETRKFFAHNDDRAVFVVHALLDSEVGEIRKTVPFYERPTLGGENTLRGYGRGRFVSNSAILLNLEERLSVVRRAVMGNLIELEIAPFLDIGRTARSVNTDGTVRFMQFNPGVGVRVLARPNIAGRMDVAYGQDGANVFVGLDYPF